VFLQLPDHRKAEGVGAGQRNGVVENDAIASGETQQHLGPLGRVPRQLLGGDDGNSLFLVDGQRVVEPFVSQTTAQLDLDRPCGVTAADLGQTATPFPGVGKAADDRVLDEAQRVEQGRLAAAVRADQRRDRRDVVEGDVAQNAVVADTQSLDVWPRGVPFGHQRASLISWQNSSNRPAASCGPAAASGWYCTENAGASTQRRPSTVPSFGQ